MNTNREDGRTQVWLVAATQETYEAGDWVDTSCFMWAFFKREEAGLVYNMGKKARPDLVWTNTALAFGSVEAALHHVELLKADLTTEEN
jgi:hypothetical protein